MPRPTEAPGSHGRGWRHTGRGGLYPRGSGPGRWVRFVAAGGSLVAAEPLSLADRWLPSSHSVSSEISVNSRGRCVSVFKRLRRLYFKLLGRQVLPAGIRIGTEVHIGDASRFDWSHGRHITIKDGAILAPGVRLLCHDASSVRRIGGTWVAPITIEAGAFIGTEAVIMPGVTVGKSAVVAAGAVVTRNVDPGTIVAGIPAKQIGLVADLDSRRQKQLLQVPKFTSKDYDQENLSDEKDRELRDAVDKYGGYFLV